MTKPVFIDQSLTNFKTIITTLNRNELVANWSQTCIYNKSSWKGRFWNIIRLITCSSEKSLRSTLQKSNKTFMDFAPTAAEALCKSFNHLQSDKSYWKKNDINITLEWMHMYEVWHNTLNCFFNETSVEGFEHLEKTLDWALGNHEAATRSRVDCQNIKPDWLEKAQTRMGKVKYLGLSTHNIPVLIRELSFAYPKDDAELIRRRDALQPKPYFAVDSRYYLNDLGNIPKYTPMHCPPEYLYAPLVACARDIAKSKADIEKIKQFCREITNHTTPTLNEEMLLNIVSFLRDTSQKNLIQNLPQVVQQALQKEYYVQKCDYHVTTVDFHCRKELRKERIYEPVLMFGPLPSYGFHEQQQAYHVKTRLQFTRDLDDNEKIFTEESENPCS